MAAPAAQSLAIIQAPLRRIRQQELVETKSDPTALCALRRREMVSSRPCATQTYALLTYTPSAAEMTTGTTTALGGENPDPFLYMFAPDGVFVCFLAWVLGICCHTFPARVFVHNKRAWCRSRF
jgi:hypothetical protein